MGNEDGRRDNDTRDGAPTAEAVRPVSPRPHPEGIRDMGRVRA